MKKPDRRTQLERAIDEDRAGQAVLAEVARQEWGREVAAEMRRVLAPRVMARVFEILTALSR